MKAFELILKNRQDSINISSISDLEYQFYITFNISKINDETAYFTGNAGYKPITAITILQLIAILNKHLSQGLGVCMLISGCDVFDIYEDVLNQCIKDNKSIYNDVRDLFGETIC